MKKLICQLIIFLSFSYTYGQSTISGKVVDKSDNKALTNASIVLLNQDSILKYFARADESGNFMFKGLAKDSYIMMVSYPKFERYTRPIKVENTDVKLEDIKISSQMNLIEEVLIEQKIPIRIKGDTLEYDAGSFETEKNAKLEDLFRRLPGMTVSATGDITAQGKTVSKVLIDGEEFFGYDPKIAIRNVRADAVDKVQVYERRSEESEFTGIDDGERFQTINVVLKDEARAGIFGNVEAGYGTENLYTGNLFAAKFNRTERIGITGNLNNMGASTGGRENSLRNNSRITGNPHAESVGANYENQFFNRKLNVNANYNFDNAGNRTESETFSRDLTNLEEIQESRRQNKNNNNNQSNGVRTQFRLRLDSTQSMEIRFNANIGTSEQFSQSTDSIRFQDGPKARDSEARNNSISNSNSNDIRINYRKRLNRNGRSVNLHLSNRYNSSDSENKVYTNDYDYRENVRTIIDQNRLSDNTGNNFETQLSFNDRLSTTMSYSIGYSFRNTNSTALTDAFDLDGNGNLLSRDSTYSKNQIDNNSNQVADLSLNYNTEKWNISLTNRTLLREQSLEDTYRDIDWSRTFWDNNMNLNANYTLSRSKRLGVTYQNGFNIPSFNQLQIVQPKVNEYYRVVGNPDLQRSMNNNFRINYNTFSLLKGRAIDLNGNINITSNPIVTKTDIDGTRRTVTYENVKGKSNINSSFNANHNRPIGNKNIQFNQFVNISYGDEYNYINKSNNPGEREFVLNNSKNTRGSIGLSLNEQNSSGFDFDINARVGLNAENNSARSDLDATNFTAGSTGYIKYFLPKKFYITTNAVYSYTGPTKLLPDAIHQFYTNLELSKTVLKSESLVISVKAFDLLGTFNNVERNVSNTNFSETQQLILTRYVLFGLKWDFNKNLGKKKDD